MKVNKIDNNTSFGLRAQTHEYITLKTAKEFANLSDDIAQKFAHYVQKPDFDETGLKIFGKDTCNNHFYYFPKTFRTRESHLDFDRKHNAFSRYIDHICNMFTNINYKNKEGVIEEAARAKHFLDDMSVGQHVERGTIFKKYKDEKIHKEFEAYIYDNQDKFYKNYSKSNLDKNYVKTDYDYDDLFVASVKTSLENELPNEANRNKWNEIAQNTINLNIDTSREFFRLFKSLFD